MCCLLSGNFNTVVRPKFDALLLSDDVEKGSAFLATVKELNWLNVTMTPLATDCRAGLVSMSVPLIESSLQ